MDISNITSETMLSDVLEFFPEAVPVFMSIGMHCLGCAMASGENIEQACMVHGVDADEFVEHLKAYLSEI